MPDMSSETLKTIYRKLRKEDHKDAALVVADMLMMPTPEDWAVQNQHRYPNKVRFIKEMRNEFDVSLMQGKDIADEVFKKDEE